MSCSCHQQPQVGRQVKRELSESLNNSGVERGGKIKVKSREGRVSVVHYQWRTGGGGGGGRESGNASVADIITSTCTCMSLVNLSTCLCVDMLSSQVSPRVLMY